MVVNNRIFDSILALGIFPPPVRDSPFPFCVFVSLFRWNITDVSLRRPPRRARVCVVYVCTETFWGRSKSEKNS